MKLFTQYIKLFHFILKQRYNLFNIFMDVWQIVS